MELALSMISTQGAWEVLSIKHKDDILLLDDPSDF